MLFAVCGFPGIAAAGDVSGAVTVPKGKSPELSVVYVSAVAGRQFVPPAEPAVMDQRLKTYTPHVLVVQKGQRVRFPNTDLIRHNVYSPSKTHPFNLGIYPPGVKKEEVFDKPGVVSLLCNVHPEMSAFLVVVETPWWALTDKDGHFEIKDVPPGRYEFVIWHEGLPETRETIEVKGRAQLVAFKLHKES